MAKKSLRPQKEQLFEETLIPAQVGSGRLFDVNYEPGTATPIECFGIQFPSGRGTSGILHGKATS